VFDEDSDEAADPQAQVRYAVGNRLLGSMVPYELEAEKSRTMPRVDDNAKPFGTVLVLD
jgi:hypothetical protein